MWPVLPVGIEDRDADIWEPLIAIADAAGGKWPDLARSAAVTLVNESKDRPATLGIRLLADVKKVMEGTDRISSVELVDRLCALESAPWSSIKGAPIDSRFLSRMFDKYDIDRVEIPRTFKIDGKAVKGYTRQHFADAWARYVPEPSPEVGNPGNPGNDVRSGVEQ